MSKAGIQLKKKAKGRSFTRVLPSIFSSRFLSYILVFVSSALLLFSLANPKSLTGVRTNVNDMFLPLLSVIGQPFMTVSNAFGSVTGLTELRAENRRLRAENMRLQEWYQTALMLRAENQSLQKLLNLKVEAPHHFISTRIVSRSAGNYIHSVLIAAGLEDGVRKNQVVVSESGVLGRVIEAGEKSARVLLVTDYNSRIPVVIEGTTQRAVLVGTNTNTLFLKHLERRGDIPDQAKILTSGHAGIFPAGLPVGRLVKGNERDYKILPFADAQNISFVRVINTDIDPNYQPSAQQPF